MLLTVESTLEAVTSGAFSTRDEVEGIGNSPPEPPPIRAAVLDVGDPDADKDIVRNVTLGVDVIVLSQVHFVVNGAYFEDFVAYLNSITSDKRWFVHDGNGRQALPDKGPFVSGHVLTITELFDSWFSDDENPSLSSPLAPQTSTDDDTCGECFSAFSLTRFWSMSSCRGKKYTAFDENFEEFEIMQRQKSGKYDEITFSASD
uniref:Uncharacterized protein n=1 Tax=Romanomermis culicivorax TaxID=13658 RepID=A0A915HY66_ROMCU